MADTELTSEVADPAPIVSFANSVALWPPPSWIAVWSGLPKPKKRLMPCRRLLHSPFPSGGKALSSTPPVAPHSAP